ncbi:MAG: hypothetical protein U0228_28750 [Myxococcaceae bacterium]
MSTGAKSNPVVDPEATRQASANGAHEGGVGSLLPDDVKDTVIDLAKNANSALNGVSDAVGLTEKVEQAPYAMVAAALGIGYVVGGGLFTPTTARLFKLGMKLTSIPAVRNRLLDVAEAAIDGVLANAAGHDGNKKT